VEIMQLVTWIYVVGNVN